MKIRQAPVADLLKYIEDLYSDKENNIHDHILDLLNDYYCCLTRYKTIMPVGNDIMADWCDQNWSTTMDNCPNVPGIIVYKNNKDGSKTYGLLYHSGYIVPKEYQTNYLGYFDIDKNGHIASHTYLSRDWDGWGAPTRYFFFDPSDYVESKDWDLGERPLMLNKMGHDVRVLQTLLKRHIKDLNVTGYFDMSTLEALNIIREFCSVPVGDTFIIKSPDGNKIMEYLTRDN